MLIRFTDLTPSRPAEKAIDTLEVPVGFLLHESVFLNVIIGICNLYRVKNIKMSADFLIKRGYGPIGPWIKPLGSLKFMKTKLIMPFAETLTTLILDDETYPAAPPLLQHSAIHTIVYKLTGPPPYTPTNEHLSSIREHVSGDITESNYNVRKVEIWLGKKLGQENVKSMPSAYTKIVTRNKKKWRIDHTVRLLGMAKFRRLPHLLGRDVMGIMAKMVWDMAA